MRRENFLEKVVLQNATNSSDYPTENSMPEKLSQKLFFKNRTKRLVFYDFDENKNVILGKNGPRN